MQSVATRHAAILALAMSAMAVACVEAPAAPANREAWLARVERARADCLAFVARVSVGVRDARTRAHPAPDVARDPTLRDGDIVVRSDGLAVYRDAGAASLSPPEIVPLVISQSQAHARELAEIARALRMPRTAPLRHVAAKVD